MDAILSAEPGKSPGREKWVASFVTRVGEGDTKFLCAEIATWGNSQAPFRNALCQVVVVRNHG